MSTSLLRVAAIVATLVAAAATGVAAGLLAADGEALNATVAAAAFAGAAVAGLAVLATLGGRLKAPVIAPAAPPVAAEAGAAQRAGADRQALIDLCVYVRDRATSKAIADKLGAGLAAAGVGELTPVGERFDPSRHEAGGVSPAPDPSQDGLIAAVETVGYQDGATVLRAPIVTVYRAGGGR